MLSPSLSLHLQCISCSPPALRLSLHLHLFILLPPRPHSPTPLLTCQLLFEVDHLLWIIEAVLHLHQDVHVFSHHFLDEREGRTRSGRCEPVSLWELLQAEVTDVADNYIQNNEVWSLLFLSHRVQHERSYKSQQK